MSPFECATIEPKQPATHAVIWLHGLGANGNDFVPIAPSLELPQSLACRFIFPHAPIRPVTLNLGRPMPSWFDIYGIDFEQKQDERGIQETSLALIKLIEQQQNQDIPSKNIILAGFSQGGAMALHTGLHYNQPLAGIVGLSTFLPLHYQFGEKTASANKKTPIFLAHGTFDEAVKFEYGELTKQFLEQQQHPVDWHTYPIAHTVSSEEISDLGVWISEAFARE